MPGLLPFKFNCFPLPTCSHVPLRSSGCQLENPIKQALRHVTSIGLWYHVLGIPDKRHNHSAWAAQWPITGPY